MHKPTWPVVLLILLAAPALGQELSVEPASSSEGSLLIHSGTFTAGPSLVASGHCLQDEVGRRQQMAEVRFDPPFRDTPQVQVALNALDFGVHDETPRNVRLAPRADNVTPAAMTLIVETWCGSNLYGAGGTYFAMGEPEGLSSAEPADLASTPPEPATAAGTSEANSDLPAQW